MPLVKIDGQESTVENGTLVLEAAKQLGIEIPHYCYHPALAVVASCRMCLVKIEGFPKLVPSCQTRIGEMPPERKVDGKYDMVVTTRSDEVKDAQESILEFLLLNHPVDCPECDQAGECLLQDYSYKYGKDKSRFDFAKRVPPRKDLGPNMLLIATRCILCSRCIRFTNEITGTNELMVKNRGARSEIELFPGQSLNNKLSMCTADVCPVGALVTKDFLHKPRTWRYRKTHTVCPGCSVGCNIEIDYMEEDNNIYRIKPVYNQLVNEWWMCDEGRLLYHTYKKLNRLQFPQVKSGDELQRTNWKAALKMVQQTLSGFSPGQIAAVGSGYATNEENYLLQKIFRDGLKTKNIAINDKYRSEDDVVYPKFTIKGEKLPNYQGAADVLRPEYKFSDLLQLIDTGKIKALYIMGGSPHFDLAENDMEILRKLEFLAVQDIQASALTELANVVLPGASAYEKDGTMTNYRNVVQRLRASIMPPMAAKPDVEILSELGELYGLPSFLSARQVFNELAEQIDGYAGMDYSTLGKTGVKKGTVKVEKELV